MLSPSSGRRDSIAKFRAYFSLPSVRHCLILDPESATLLHYARQEDGAVLSTALTSGTLRLDPPGLEVEVEALFARLNRERNGNR